MKLYHIALPFIFLLSGLTLTAQSLSGTIVEPRVDGKSEPVPGVQVFWLGTSTGAITDTAGNFKLPKVKGNNSLVIRYTGYPDDTIDTKGKKNLSIEMEKIREFGNGSNHLPSKINTDISH